MPGCAAIGCNNRSEKGYTMKCFPRNPKLRKIWTERVSRADWEPSNNSFLCHVHFEADQWTITQSGRIKLKKNAVPSIFTVTSTRKSPRKRRKHGNVEDEDLYIIEYLDDSSNRKITPTNVPDTTYERYRTSNITTIIGRPIYNRSSCRTASKIVMENNRKIDTIVISDEKSGTSIGETINAVDDHSLLDFDEKKIDNSEIEVKTEMNSTPIDSNREIDDIEEKLRLICDGESIVSEKTVVESTKIDKKCEQDEKKKKKYTSTEVKYSEGEKFIDKFSKTEKNVNSTKNEETKVIISEPTSRKRQSKLENIEKTTVENSINGVQSREKKLENFGSRTAEDSRKSTFTIKLTGIEEDVTEIVEGLGTEPILKYKSSNESSGSNKNFVTSIISVTNEFSIKTENNGDEVKPRLKIVDCSNNDEKIGKTTITNGNEDKITAKLSLESPDDDENLMDHRQLRKKIKFQEQVIEKLTKQLRTRGESETAIDTPNTRYQSKKRKMDEKCCNCDSQNKSKEELIRELLSKLKDSNDTIKLLKKYLNEERRNMKNSQLQIRQRDNRIKELNWKLNKASKYIERAEKNANTYRKKMINLQSALTKKTLDVRNNEKRIDSANNEKINIQASETTAVDSSMKIDVTRSSDENQKMSSERFIYRTVQDIFDESNGCDDEPIIIDNPEDFMRQFAGSL